MFLHSNRVGELLIYLISKFLRSIIICQLLYQIITRVSSHMQNFDFTALQLYIKVLLLGLISNYMPYNLQSAYNLQILSPVCTKLYTCNIFMCIYTVCTSSLSVYNLSAQLCQCKELAHHINHDTKFVSVRIYMYEICTAVLLYVGMYVGIVVHYISNNTKLNAFV